jgi:hypothetical protein
LIFTLLGPSSSTSSRSYRLIPVEDPSRVVKAVELLLFARLGVLVLRRRSRKELLEGGLDVRDEDAWLGRESRSLRPEGRVGIEASSSSESKKDGI